MSTPTRRRPRPGRRPSSTEWLELLATDGPFLAAPVVTDTWPSGLPALDKDSVGRLREASSRLDASPGTRDAFIRHVLADLLGWATNLAAAGHVPPTLTTTVAEYATDIRPDFALLPTDSEAPARPLLLGMVLDPGVDATARPRPTSGGGWVASPADRLAYLLRAQQVPLGLVTDGTAWTLVCAPPGGATTTAMWTRPDWFETPDTLKAFVALLGRLRFFGVPDDQTLPALLAASLQRQEEVTERLSEQSQAVVEMLVATIGRLDADHLAEHGRPLLPAGVEPAEVYQAAVTVLMRLVFLLYAEEGGLLPADDDTYADAYAAGTLAGQLSEQASNVGEDTLERASTGWARLLATARLVHRGARHEQLNLPGYGGSLFDPDRFPWLEGRPDADAPLDTAIPLPVDDRTMLRAIEALQWLRFSGERRRVSFRVLDVEQIGYVYEGLLDQDARRAEDWVLGIARDNRGEKDGPEMSLADLEQHLADGHESFAAWLSPLTAQGGTRRSPAAILKALTAAAEGAWTGVLEACAGDEDTARRVLPFAGLLRRDPRDLPVVYPPGSLYLTDSALRAYTGAVYTPRLLAETVVARILAPLVMSPGPLDSEDPAAWRIRPPQDILELKVIDIAAGSGAFLVAATRYLADRLLEAQLAHTPGAVPASADDTQLALNARRRVLDHCIYGVDVNPMALEMCKLSLWLITVDRTLPFGFLDDRLAVGDSVLGITSTDQLLALHMDPRAGRRLHDETLPLWTAETPALLKQAAELRAQIADVDLIDNHAAEHKTRLLAQARDLTGRLTILADALSGASLAGGEDSRYLRLAALAETATTATGAIAREDAYRQLAETAQFALTDTHGQVRRPAHFPLLFPEVFAPPASGFDAVVGNPPFLGGQKLTGAYGIPYRERLVRDVGHGARGSADLIAYMFLTAAALGDRDHGTFGLLGTNTVAQGDTRQVGLDQIIAGGHHIYAAVKSEKWPTQAANLEYSIVWASRHQRAPGVRANADGVPVPAITPSLDPAGRVTGNPHRLAGNAGLSFQGSNVLGMGFTLTETEAQGLIDRDPRNANVLFPYVNGHDLNSRPDSSGSRWIINFFDWPEDQARDYPDCYAIVRDKVKPERDKVKHSEHARVHWWQYERFRPALYTAIDGLAKVLVLAQVSRTVQPVFVPNRLVYSHKLVVFATEDAADLANLTSALHYWWAIRYSATMRTDLSYSPSDVAQTFPRPVSTERMRAGGRALDVDRRTFMLARRLGLTSTYNLVHDPAVADVEVAHLRALHVEVDEGVCAAYGWEDLPLDHDHHDTRQGVRWTVSPAARVELLDRLLELNHARHAEEQRSGRREGAGGRRTGSVGPAGQDEQAMLFHDDEDR